MSVGVTPRPARPVRWPWLAFAGFIVLAVTGMALVVANREALTDQVFFVATFSLFGIVGALIASRVPGNRIGALLLFVSGVTALTFVANEYTTYRTRQGATGSMEAWGALIGEVGWLIGLTPGLVLLLLWFPDGRPPSPRWRWLTRLLTLAVVWGLLAIAGEPTFSDNGVASPMYVSWLEPIARSFGIGFLLFVALLTASVVSLVLRFRRSDGSERQQIKWVAFAAVVMFAGLLIAQLFMLSDVIVALSLATLPIAIGVAVLRYRLWDLDVVVRKTLLAGLVILILMVAFVVLSFIGQSALDLGGATEAVVAALVGFAVWPAFRIARRLADLIVYGGRATPYEVLAGFADRVGATYAGDDVLQRMVTAVGEGIGAERADLWIDRAGRLALAATWPPDSPEALVVGDDDDRSASFLIEFNGEPLGRLGARKAAGERMSGTDHKLIASLAAQAGPVLHNVSLTEVLRDRLEELQAARRRLVTAQDEERRRLERNIHDGAQQQLVALAVKARLVRTITERDPAKAAEMLVQMEAETQTALEDLRDLARGIYPPLLADKGLAAALEAQARRAPVPVEVHAPERFGRFPAEVEAAVYFSCLEALQNVAKYASANTTSIELSNGDGALRFTVTDDGRGFDPETNGSGTGLQGIADRLGALDGTLLITSAPGAGTIVAGEVPV